MEIETSYGLIHAYTAHDSCRQRLSLEGLTDSGRPAQNHRQSLGVPDQVNEMCRIL